MKECISCKESMRQCMDTHTFAFAHFKSMDIIPVMPEYAKAQTDIQTMQKQYEDEIKRASDEYSL